MIPCRNVLSGSAEASQISSQVSCASKNRRLLNCFRPAANRSLCSRAAFSAAAPALLAFIQRGLSVLAVALALGSHSERSEESLRVASSRPRPLCVAGLHSERFRHPSGASLRLRLLSVQREAADRSCALGL